MKKSQLLFDNEVENQTTMRKVGKNQSYVLLERFSFGNNYSDIFLYSFVCNVLLFYWLKIFLIILEPLQNYKLFFLSVSAYIAYREILAFRSSALRLARWRNLHWSFLSSTAFYRLGLVF